MLRPLAKLLTAHRRFLNKDLKSFEQKIHTLLISIPIINLHEKYPKLQQLQTEAEEEFLNIIYREVELHQLKAMIEDAIAKEILQEDQQQQNLLDSKLPHPV